MAANIKQKRSRTSAEQLSKMADFMLETPGLATGRFYKVHGKCENDRKWSEMATMLNSLGGTTKTVEQWHTVWRDLKSRTSQKVRDRKRQQALTGNKPITEEPITELERRVIGLIGKEYVEGHDAVMENVPVEEQFQLRLEEGDDSVMSEMTSTWEKPATICDTPTSMAKKTPRRCWKRKREEDADIQAKFLDIAKKQADALMMLAEANVANVSTLKVQAESLKIITECQKESIQANKMLAEAVTTMGEGLKSIASALNKFTATLDTQCI